MRQRAYLRTKLPAHINFPSSWSPSPGVTVYPHDDKSLQTPLASNNISRRSRLYHSLPNFRFREEKPRCFETASVKERSRLPSPGLRVKLFTRIVIRFRSPVTNSTVFLRSWYRLTEGYTHTFTHDERAAAEKLGLLFGTGWPEGRGKAECYRSNYFPDHPPNHHRIDFADAPRVNVLAMPDRDLILLLKERCIPRRPGVRHQLHG